MRSNDIHMFGFFIIAWPNQQYVLANIGMTTGTEHHLMMHHADGLASLPLPVVVHTNRVQAIPLVSNLTSHISSKDMEHIT